MWKGNGAKGRETGSEGKDRKKMKMGNRRGRELKEWKIRDRKIKSEK